MKAWSVSLVYVRSQRLKDGRIRTAVAVNHTATCAETGPEAVEMAKKSTKQVAARHGKHFPPVGFTFCQAHVDDLTEWVPEANNYLQRFRLEKDAA